MNKTDENETELDTNKQSVQFLVPTLKDYALIHCSG
jgi:hypothetical protein